MFLLRRPNEEQIRRVLAAQKDHPLYYSDIDAAIGNVRGDYNRDHNRTRLGEGVGVFERAVEAINRWEMFNIGWVELCWPDVPIAPHSMVAVLASHVGFWSLNVCRIVSVIDERSESRRYGFIYGTLPDHAERGQEQFSVEWRRTDDSVWYDILAYSRPNQFLAKLGYPVARLLQKRFARDSMAAMVRASS